MDAACIKQHFAGKRSRAARCDCGTCEGSRPAGPHRVLRGGSWNNNSASNLLSSNRNNDQPGNRNDNNGFRLVLVVGSGGKASLPTDHRDGGPGQKPLPPRGKNTLNRMTSPWRKRAHGWGLAVCHDRGWRSLRSETHHPRQGQDAVPARDAAVRGITGASLRSPSAKRRPCVRFHPGSAPHKEAAGH